MRDLEKTEKTLASKKQNSEVDSEFDRDERIEGIVDLLDQNNLTS